MRIRLRSAIVGAVVLSALGALSPIGFGSSSPAARVDVGDESDVLLPSARNDAEATIAALTGRMHADPSNPKIHAQLGLAYLQKSRSQADPSALPLAERSLERSLDLQPTGNLEAFVGMASLGNARHDFTRSVQWARRAIATNPYSSSAYGLLGDALFELGDVRRADRAYQRMVDVRPEVASYVRASYSLQYHGRTRAAIGTMRLALQAAGPAGETAAYVHHQLGDIFAATGNYRTAARENRIGAAVAPGYVPPTVGIAESYIAMGRVEKALPILEVAAEEMPTLEYMITLGNLYRATGRTEEADAQYAAVARKLADYRAAGVKVDADFTVFYADHGLRLRAAAREARAAYAERPTKKISDSLAWVLHARGRDREAWTYATAALRGPVRDWAAVFHAGVIATSRGREAMGARLTTRALRHDPTLSVRVPS